jgi:polyhydroxybutyrate depolymerase
MARILTVLSGAGLMLLALFVFTPEHTPDVQAAGCFPGKPHASGSTNETVSITGQGTRRYRLHIPPSYNGADRVPLVLAFHGLGSNGLQTELYSALSAFSDAGPGFVVVYPEGMTNGFGQQFWQFVPSASPNDVLFTSELLDALDAQLCINTDYVFSTGISNGAIMSSRLACSLSSRIAAIAPVAGAYYPPLFSTFSGEDCPDTRPVPFLSFHGTDDSTIPYNGGPGLNGADFRLPQDNTTPDEDVTNDWALHNGCTGSRAETQIDTEVRLIEYGSCMDGADVQHYAIDGGGHTWPGAIDIPSLGYTTHQISATSLMWDFFLAHPFAIAPDVDTDGDTIPNATDQDNDNDGCSDAQEVGISQNLGGQRDSKNFWDYADMPIVAASPLRDGRVRINDILAVIGRYFTNDAGGTAPINRNSDPLSVPPATGYHPAFDRGGLAGPNQWNLAPPDGQILLDDVLAVVYQYFHDCA